MFEVVRFFKICGVALGCLLACSTHPLPAKTPEGPRAEPFFNTQTILRMIAGIEARENGAKIKIAVGDFNYGETDMQSALSVALADDLASELKRSGLVDVATRDDIAKMTASGALSSKALQPDMNVPPAAGSMVSGIVRGRFFNAPDGVQVETELVRPDGEPGVKTTSELPATILKERLGGKACTPGDGGIIEPQNLPRSEETYKQVVADRIEKIPSDFHVEIQTREGKRAYVAGESIGFLVRSNEDCHITVLCHQSDGNTVVLFPNRWHPSTKLNANEPLEIPAPACNFNLRIGPPFGSDVVEVIACSTVSEILKQLAEKIPPSDSTTPFHVVTRGIVVEGVDASTAAAITEHAPQRRWGRDYIVVSSFPSN